MERETGFETVPRPWRAALYQLSYSRAIGSLSRLRTPLLTGGYRAPRDPEEHVEAVRRRARRAAHLKDGVPTCVSRSGHTRKRAVSR